MTAITKVETVHEAESPLTITAMLQSAVQQGASVDALEKLVALHERVTDRAARSEFAFQLAAFQDECPPIQKTSTAKIMKDNAVQYTYKYAELDEIARTVRPLLHHRGFSYGWDSALTDKILTCTCTLRHVNGHHEKATFATTTDNRSAMSEQQKHAAALTYAKRQSLIQVLGITTAEPDTDAANPTPITDEQATTLTALAEEAKVSLPKFLKYMGCEAIKDIRASDYTRAVRALDARRKAADK